MKAFTIPFENIHLSDLPEVGGKNASLGEMFNSLQSFGIEVPNGFAITAESYRHFLSENTLVDSLRSLLNSIDRTSLAHLSEVAEQCRALIASGVLTEGVKQEIKDAYRHMGGNEQNVAVAVRSSATAEDLPQASFAGQHDSFLNVKGEEQLLLAVKKCYESLFNDRAIKYRIDHGFDHLQVNLSVGVQLMVRADLACAGVIFTIDPESGFKGSVYITGSWGLGENVVQGAVNPDEYWVFKTTLQAGKNAIIKRKKGEKEMTMVYAEGAGNATRNIETSFLKRQAWILSDLEVSQLAQWSCVIEEHYHASMDIEWAKDGLNGRLYIVQARPETVQSQKNYQQIQTFSLQKDGKVLCKGRAVGNTIISGRACIIHSLAEANKLQTGDIIVAEITNPDWNTLLRKAVSIITDKGGRTSHASIVARELGVSAVVGTGNATTVIQDGQLVTVDNSEGDEGRVLDGKIPFQVISTDLTNVPKVKTNPLFILANPDRAFELSHYPTRGVGLLRMEFIISNSICIHPMALAQFDQFPEGTLRDSIASMTADYVNKGDYFIDKLAEAIATVAAAFFPHQVILRTSDFKSNEYASLIGGESYEPKEGNPMLGFRGASRYYDPRYQPGFGLECKAILKVRNDMGLTNLKVMIPFCRTVQEAEKVLQTMESFGLKRHDNGLEVYVMVEIPSNVILADQFATLFDGFSIGSNDLTQLTLGLDRDSEIVSQLFDENNEAVTTLIGQAIHAAKKAGINIGLCGQAPSDFPLFSQFLVEKGIDSISFNPDALMKGIENIAKAEHALRL